MLIPIFISFVEENIANISYLFTYLLTPFYAVCCLYIWLVIIISFIRLMIALKYE
jgi:ABC-type transport system involved in cytochrome bd biosynthesis fused ATPase/permease subunit